MQKTKRLYQDTRAQRNMDKLNEDLGDIHRILTKNIQEVLERGEKLESTFPVSLVWGAAVVVLTLSIQLCPTWVRLWQANPRSTRRQPLS